MAARIRILLRYFSRANSVPRINFSEGFGLTEMEQEVYAAMSVKDVAPSSNDGEVVKREGDARKRQRSDRCFSFVEISIEPGIKSLKDLDSFKFKSEIKRWAKAVVTYARQVSDRFGSSRRSQESGDRFGSSRRSSS